MNRHFSRCCPGGFTSVVLPRFWHPAPLDSNLQARTPAGPPVYRRLNSAGRRSTSQLAGENGQCAFLTAFPDALLAGPSETGVPRLRFPEYRCASAFFEPCLCIARIGCTRAAGRLYVSNSSTLLAS